VLCNKLAWSFATKFAATKFARYAPKGFKLKPDLFQSVPKFSRAGANNFHRFVNLLTFVSATVWQLSLGSQLDELRWMLLSTTFNFKAQATHSCLGLSSYECRRCCKWIHTGNVMFWYSDNVYCLAVFLGCETDIVSESPFAYLKSDLMVRHLKFLVGCMSSMP